MGTKYSTVSITSYNASPPADDGTQDASNQVNWSKHKTKLGDPLKTAIEAIDSALVDAFAQEVLAKAADYTITAADNNKTVVATSNGVTISLPDAATAASGFIASVVCADGLTDGVTIDLATAADLMNGVTNGSVTIPANAAMTFIVNSGQNGYNIKTTHNVAINGTGVVEFSAGLVTDGSSYTITLPAGNITLNDAITNLTEDTSPDLVADYVKTYDADAAVEKKVLLARIGGGVYGNSLVASSGTSIDFTGIPSWVKKIKVILSGVSTDSTTLLMLQIGDSGGLENSGYAGIFSGAAASGSNAGAWGGTGFEITTTRAAAGVTHGMVELVNINGNEWVMTSICSSSASSYLITHSTGTKTLTGTLDRLSLTTTAGADTFDAGTVNIHYE